MQSRSPIRSRWHHCNTPEAKRRRRAANDARREALAATLPPVVTGPEPLSLWQTVVILGPDGAEQSRITLYVPTRGRCDQHAAEIDGDRRLITATELGRLVASKIRKRPSVAAIAEARSW